MRTTEIDPKECLRQADQFINGLEFLDARIRLAEYWRWRASGGFEPIEVADTLKHGDEFARECRHRLEEAMSAKPVTYSVCVDEPPMPWGQEGFTSLQSALDWATTEAKRIEQKYLDELGDDWKTSAPDGQISCEDSLGNSWSLIEENGIFSWDVADVVIDQYPIVELPQPEVPTSSLSNRDRFIADLTSQYEQLFELPEYEMAKARQTPQSLAVKMTDGLALGRANKDGDGIKRTCKALGIKYTYTAIRAYLAGDAS